MNAIKLLPDGLIIKVYIQTNASYDQIVGLQNNELKITIMAPPINGKANKHLLKYFAKQFQVAKKAVSIEKGMLSRHKKVRIINPQNIPIKIAILMLK